MLMVAGMEKYFQIVRCFRDEDLRADRQPEFTQLDIEMSFIEQEDILTLMEEMIAYIFKNTLNTIVETPIQRITYADAMSKYGSDKPDLRFDMQLIDVTEIVRNSDFKVFASVAAAGGQIKSINAKGCANMPRREVDALASYVAVYGAKGLAYIYVTEEGIKSPIIKFFTENQMQEILSAVNAEVGDLVFFVADKPAVVADSLGHLRLHLAEQLKLIPENSFNFVWVIDFPLFEYDEEEKRYVAIHHMFTSPKDEDMHLLESDPLAVRAKAYDLALNGIELGGGSIRIHKRDIQEKIFSLLGMNKDEAYEKFGYMLEAFEFGTPPHGGIAFGVDRMLMLMAGKDTIRDCIAFPKTQSASCHMTDAPSTVASRQLKELHIKLDVLPKSK
jgi:aspartyl-tRNA synthetase